MISRETFCYQIWFSKFYQFESGSFSRNWEETSVKSWEKGKWEALSVWVSS